MAAGYSFLSLPFIFWYGLVILNLGIYAVVWQQIIKHLPLTTAYANKAVTIVWGILWGSLFFVFMSFAALSTVLAVFEQLLSCTMELFGWSRKKACLINGVAMFVLSLPCILGFNVWKDFAPLGEKTNIMDLEDFLVSNILLPVGSLIFVLFCTIRYGWGWKKFMEEANEGRGLKVAKWMRPYMTFVLPVIIISIFLIGLWNFFK